MNTPVFFVFLGLYVIDVVLQLYACLKEKERLRRITKILLMPLLALTYFVASSTPQILVILGLLFGCLGDTFLLNHHSRIGFPAGLCAFFIGHVLYVLAILPALNDPSLWLILPVGLVYALGAIRTFTQLKPYLPKNLVILCLLYMLLLASFSAVAALNAILLTRLGSILIFCGTLFFLVSDTVLSFNTFKEEKKGGNFIVMLTYIIAQTLIACGLLLFIDIPC